MGLRLHRKYLLLIGTIFITGFLITSVTFYDQPTSKEVPENVVRDIPNRYFKNVKAVVKSVSSQKNESIEDVNLYRRNYMMLFAWNSYKTYAWGENELKSNSKIPHRSSVFGRAPLGASIVDAIDTLYIMNLMDEFNDAREWVASSFDMKLAIRFVGGFLSAYALTADKIFLTKAQEVADLLLPAFNTPTGIPLAIINMQTGHANNYGWASGGCSILSEFGSIEMEFDFLSRVTGNKTYLEKVRHVRNFLKQAQKPDGLYPLFLSPRTGKFYHFSVGALGDSFYEYLFKVWLLNNKTDKDLKEMYDSAIKAIEANLLFKSKPNNLWYLAEKKGNRIEHKMAHLTCFVAGLFALQSKHETEETVKHHFLELAEKLANTCHESYIRTDTGIGPETFRFNDKNEATTSDNENYYILRPEVIESWFVLYRITGDNKYREWCWAVSLLFFYSNVKAVEAIEKYCKAEAGYSGIRNVYSKDRQEQDDVQQSFFLSETLKYLFLVFSDSDKISLDKWVFNTEAHPFPILIS